MSQLLVSKVQAGSGDASRWLKLSNIAYSEKLGMAVFPSSLNIALDHVFDSFNACYEATEFGSAGKSTGANATYCWFRAD